MSQTLIDIGCLEIRVLVRNRPEDGRPSGLRACELLRRIRVVVGEALACQAKVGGIANRGLPAVTGVADRS